MGYANTTTGYRGIVSSQQSVQCLGINVSKSLDNNGNVVLEVRTPVVAKTSQTVKEYVGLSSTDANGNGPAATYGEWLFKPWAIIDTSGTTPFVSYERQVSRKREGGLWSVIVTERSSVLA